MSQPRDEFGVSREEPCEFFPPRYPKLGIMKTRGADVASERERFAGRQLRRLPAARWHGRDGHFTCCRVDPQSQGTVGARQLQHVQNEPARVDRPHLVAIGHLMKRGKASRDK